MSGRPRSVASAYLHDEKVVARVISMLLKQKLIREVAVELGISVTSVHNIASAAGLEKRWVRVSK